MNEDKEKREIEEKKFREQIVELIKLEEELSSAQSLYEQIKPEFDKVTAYYKKCVAAKTRLRQLRRDYPGYFKTQSEATN